MLMSCRKRSVSIVILMASSMCCQRTFAQTQSKLSISVCWLTPLQVNPARSTSLTHKVLRVEGSSLQPVTAIVLKASEIFRALAQLAVLADSLTWYSKDHHSSVQI